MFSLSIVAGSANFRLLFKEEGKALAAYALVSRTDLENLIIEDDFGQTFCGKLNMVSAFLLEDMNKSKLAHVELILHDARTRASATQSAMSDPQLKAATMSRGPSVIQPGIGPGMNGGFRG